MVEALRSRLFGETEGCLFAVLDGASVPDLPGKLYELKPEHECLYRGRLQPDMAEVAPYLVRLEPETPFTDWVLEQGWGNHWGIFVVSAAELLELRQHFRRFLIVHDPTGKPLYFRYYDPRVLRSYLPTCNGEELAALFGPVRCYMAEGEKPELLLRFELDAGRLVSKAVRLAPQ